MTYKDFEALLVGNNIPISFLPNESPIKSIRSFSGLSQKAFSEKYHIPKRSIEDWETGKRHAPAYIYTLLAFAVYTDYDKNSR